MHVTQPEPGTYKAQVEVVIDGHKKQFFLDTGAVQTSVATDEELRQYPAVAQGQTGGNYGKLVVVDIIQPEKFELGSHVFLKPRLQRTGTNRNYNLLGLDLLAQSPFQVDLKNSKLNIVAALPNDLTKSPIHRLSKGHITVPITLGDKNCYALFDTGGQKTCIDLQFVKTNPQLFKFVRNDQGTDSTGHRQDTPIYRATSLGVGNLHLNDVEMASYGFSDEFRKSMEGIPIILGSNVIYPAKWSFDLKQGLWAVEPD